MPDDATSPVAVRTRRFDGGLDGCVHGPVLVILRHSLDEADWLVREHDEAPDEVKETLGLEDSSDEDLERGLVSDDGAVFDGLPRGVVLKASGERAHESAESVGDHAYLVGREE